MNVVIVGASSGIGAAIAKEFAEKGANVLLSASDRRDIEALSQEIQITYKHKTFFEALNIESEDFKSQDYLQNCIKLLGKIDVLVVSAGFVSDEDTLSAPEALSRKIFDVNFVRVSELLATFGSYFEQEGSGSLVAFSSIAAKVPRKKNIMYCASKRALENYCHSLRQGFKTTTIRVIVLGYVDTAMSFGKNLKFPVESTKSVARYVYKKYSVSGISYFPRFWSLIVALLSRLPWAIFKRLNF